jgi:serpin B
MIDVLAFALIALGLGTSMPVAAQQPLPAEAVEVPRPRAGASLSPEAAAFVTGMNAFAFDLFAVQRSDPGNFFVSPPSISTAMALAYRGAKAETATEIAKVMHYPSPPEASAVAAGEAYRSMSTKGPGRELATANSLWVQKGLPLNPDYVRDLGAHFGAALHEVDFKNAPDAARLLINAWVEERTNNRIRQLLAKPDVRDDTKTILVNTIYLKALWARPFEASETRSEPFRTADDRQIPMALMNQRADFRPVSRDGVQAISLPYQSGELDMVVLLPQSPAGLSAFEDGLTAAKLDEWLKRLDSAPAADTILTLPKFRMEWRADIAPLLKRLGMEIALSDSADFSGSKFVNPRSADDDELAIKIGSVIHQTFLEVDEGGAEAAAATAVVEILVTGGRMGRPPPVVFRADRPFLFLLRDRRTGALLFIGRIAEPPAA